MKVKLFVPNPAFPDDGFVTEGIIPEFNKPPDVLMWGQRVFRYVKTYDSSWDGLGFAYYEEAFCFALIDLPKEVAA